MAKVKQRRWVCPVCDTGKLAPMRPRKNDVRRYCLPCSEKTGRLVERACPANEVDAERAGERAREKAKRKAQRERGKHERSVTVDGVNLERELKRLCKLPCLGGPKGRLAKHPPNLRVRRMRKTYGQGGCYDWGAREVRINVRPGDNAGWAVETLAHEVAHAYIEQVAGTPQRNGRYSHHGSEWRRIFAEILAEGYDIGAMIEHAFGDYGLAERIHTVVTERGLRKPTK